MYLRGVRPKFLIHGIEVLGWVLNRILFNWYYLHFLLASYERWGSIGFISGKSKKSGKRFRHWKEKQANKVGLKINESKTKYEKRENDSRRWAERGIWRQNFWSRQRICVFGIPGDTEQRRESGDTEENLDCSRDICHVQQNSSSTRPWGLAVRQWDFGVD
jgi:hypothetical protein